MPPGYTRCLDSEIGRGEVYKENISVIRSHQDDLSSFEPSECICKCENAVIRLCVIYRPPEYDGPGLNFDVS